MVRPKSIIAGILVIGLGVFCIVYFLQSDQRKIKRQFQRLSESVSKESHEDRLKWMVRVQKIKRLFADNCAVTDESRSLSRTYTREEIQAHAVSALSQFSELTLGFHDLDITMSQKTTAKVILNAQVKGKRHTGEDILEVYEVKCALQEIEKDWVFTEIHVIKLLKKQELGGMTPPRRRAEG
jgi:hypothetical protein